MTNVLSLCSSTTPGSSSRQRTGVAIAFCIAALLCTVGALVGISYVLHDQFATPAPYLGLIAAPASTSVTTTPSITSTATSSTPPVTTFVSPGPSIDQVIQTTASAASITPSPVRANQESLVSVLHLDPVTERCAEDDAIQAWRPQNRGIHPHLCHPLRQRGRQPADQAGSPHAFGFRNPVNQRLQSRCASVRITNDTPGKHRRSRLASAGSELSSYAPSVAASNADCRITRSRQSRILQLSN